MYVYEFKKVEKKATKIFRLAISNASLEKELEILGIDDYEDLKTNYIKWNGKEREARREGIECIKVKTLRDKEAEKKERIEIVKKAKLKFT